MKNYTVSGGSFHVNTEDGARGYLVSRHSSLARAEMALARFNARHSRECFCGGGEVWEGATVRYGKVYGGR